MDNFADAAAGNLALQRALISLASNVSSVQFGNVYFVIPSTYANYVDLVKKYQKKYSDGTEMVQPSLAAAVAACTANRGDVIYVAPGYALTVTSSNLTLNKAGITLIALGSGLKRATLTYSTAAATINVSADNVTVMNFRHVANFLNVASAYTIGAANDFRLDNNTFDDVSSILNFLSIVVTGATDYAADGLTVINNFCSSLPATANAFISILANLSRLRVQRNEVFKDATNDAAQFITLSSKVLLSARISANKLIIVGASGNAVGIFLTGSGTTSKGVVDNNYVASLDTTTELIATAGTGLKFFENYYTGTADASGKLWPVVDAA